MHIKIISPGPLSTIQDEGRFGYMSVGFSPSGAMDSRAMRIANILAGNNQTDGVIEMTLMGITAEFTCKTVIAITGADMEPEINGNPIPMYRSVAVEKGDILSMKLAKNGLRAYLAAAGGFDIEPVMGSMSTNLKCGIGGFNGRKLMAGDELPLRRSAELFSVGRRKSYMGEEYPDSIEVRVIMGPQDDYFTENGIKTFLNSEYKVTDKSDRMGVRLSGDMIENKAGVDIISDGIVTGSIQIPPAGTPIIMMTDHQTTGGYAKIATVISTDIRKIAQAKPGTNLKFTAVSERKAAWELWKERANMGFFEYTTLFNR